MDEFNELYHHGVKGQRWGIHRTPEQLGHRLDKLNKKYGKAKVKAKKASYKSEKAKGFAQVENRWRKYKKASRKMDRSREKLIDFVNKNASSFEKYAGSMSKSQLDSVKKWTEYSLMSDEGKMWFLIGESISDKKK